MKKALLYFTFIILYFCIIQQNLFAVPAYPDPIVFTQPDGTLVNVSLKGDERFRWGITSDGYAVLFNKKGFLEYAELNKKGDLVASGHLASNPEKRSLIEKEYLVAKKKGLTFSQSQIAEKQSRWNIENKIKQKALPKTGSQKMICILIGFSDLDFGKSQDEIYDLFNQTNYTVNGATGSVRDYYSEVSYGQLDLTFDVAGPYSASHDLTYYGANNSFGNDMDPRALVEEALALADKDIDFSDYDNDGDGYADGVYVLYAGHGEEAGAAEDAIWAHAWSISPVSLDGVSVSRYSCSPELRGNSGSNLTHIGVICHELGHVLGAPDFYDTDHSGSGGSYSGTGSWDVMASGCWNNGGATPAHHNAFTKSYIYNWTDPEILNSGTSVIMQNAAFHSEDFYRFNTATTDEYYLLENRIREGFDARIPGEGLIIYHVHSDVLQAGNQINAGHPQKMYPVCANSSGIPSEDPLSYGSINSSSCPFPGTGNVSAFTDEVIPFSRSWSGENSNQPLTNIVYDSENKTISFDFMGGDSGDRGEDCSNPINLAGEYGSKNISTSGFTNDYIGSCESLGADRVYYLTTMVKNGGNINIWTTNSDYEAILYARYGSCTGTEIDCTNQPDSVGIDWQNTTGFDQHIWIIVDGIGDGNTTLNWEVDQPALPGEDCNNAYIISGVSGEVEYSTSEYIDNYTGDCGGSAKDVVFYLETPVPQGNTIQFWTSNDNYDVVLYGRYGSCEGEEIACIDDPDGTIVSWKNNTGSEQNIWIFADGYGNSNGNASLNWSIIEESDQGDNCDNAIVLSGFAGSTAYSTTGYINDYTSEGCNGTAEDVVFYLETPVPQGGTIEYWTSEDNYDVVLYARYGSCSGSQIACIDDPDGTLLSWQNETDSEQYIWIIADGFGQSDGSGILNWRISVPSNLGENCVNPIMISGDAGSIEYSTIGYKDDYLGNCSSTGGDKVYFLDTPVPDGYVLDLWTSGENYEVSLYGKYESCEGPEIGCFNEKSASVLSWKNKTGSNQGVWIIVDGYSESRGSGILHWKINQSISGIDNSEISKTITLYPNPASDKVILEFSDDKIKIESISIYGILGNLVNSFTVQNKFSNTCDIDVSGYAKGTYIIQIQMNGEVINKRLEVIK